MRDEVNDDLAVGGGLKNRAVRFELIAHRLRVDQVPVVGHCQIAQRKINEKWLEVLIVGSSRRGIPVMSDRHPAGQSSQSLLGEHLQDKTGPLLLREITAVRRDDSAPLLPPVLEGV